LGKVKTRPRQGGKDPGKDKGSEERPLSLAIKRISLSRAVKKRSIPMPLKHRGRKKQYFIRGHKQKREEREKIYSTDKANILRG